MNECSLQILIGQYQTPQAFCQALLNVIWLRVLIFTTDATNLIVTMDTTKTCTFTTLIQ